MTRDRSTFLGGSDAASVLGISPWRTPLELYLEKTEGKRDEDEQQNAKAKRRGSRLEPYIIDMLREEHDFTIIGRNAVYHDPDEPFLAAEIDAEVLDEHGIVDNVEIKTVHPYKAKDWGEEYTDSIPVHYTAQAMHGLMVTGRDVARFAVLIGDDLRLYRVERDVDAIEGMREHEVAFWREHVLAGLPPAPSTAGDVMRLFARDNGEAIEASEELVARVAQLVRVKDQRKAIEKDEEALEEEVRLFMQDAALLTHHGRILATWKTQTARRFDQKAFGAAHPEILEAFKRASDSRVLRIK